MMRINLLPHREAETQGAAAVLQPGPWWPVLPRRRSFPWSIRSSMATSAGRKQRFSQAKSLSWTDKQIEEIKRLKEQTDALCSRKQIIEALQRGRGTVHLLNELAKQVPGRHFLKSISRDNAKSPAEGYVQSMPGVDLMRNIEAFSLAGASVLVGNQDGQSWEASGQRIYDDLLTRKAAMLARCERIRKQGRQHCCCN